MKRLLAVGSLIICLALPVFGEHARPGYGMCDCDDPLSHFQGLRVDDREEEVQHNLDTEISELTLYLDAFSMLLRIRL
ncbi:MAG TPA: hypothetical protein VJQ56_07405 [Blastocatellia bacterium]|nr:hypothetical protein [Blastocatellia bacterium]